MKNNRTARIFLLFILLVGPVGCASTLSSQKQEPLLTPTVVAESKAQPSAEVQGATKSAPAENDPTVDPVTGMQFVLVKGGCYMMGDTFGIGEKDELPAHEVCVDDFYLGKYEVTQGQWEKVMGENPTTIVSIGPDFPVTSISWETARKFLAKLGSMSKRQYRLPTEGEWEYAARSGGKGEKWAGTNDMLSLKEFAVYGDIDSPLFKVGQKKPNGLGLYDMSGNAYEWCQDWYSTDYYKESPRNNPAGPEKGEERVLRGGAFRYNEATARTTKRRSDTPGDFNYSYGLRVLLPVK